MVAVFVGDGIKVGVKVDVATMAVCVCAATAVWMIKVSIEPGTDVTAGGVTSAGVAQPRMTIPRVNHKVIRRTMRLFITPPRYTLQD
jgi:hypothetical protein